MQESLSLLFVCRNFHRMAGGVEWMATVMMNEMVRRGHRVGLLTWDQAGAEAHYPLDPAVEWRTLDLGDPYRAAGWRLRARRLVAMRQHMTAFAPDVAIGFQAGTFAAARLAVAGRSLPVIAAERNSPDLFRHVRHGGRRRLLANLMLTTAPCITVQMASYRARYPPWLRGRIEAIPNPVEPAESPAYPNEAGDPRLILNVGRLSLQKNQDLLLRAFARLAPRYPDWHLALVGDGEKGDALRALAAELGIAHRVTFAGAVRNVAAWYGEAAFLAFPSLWEGFPNVVTEAFTQGVPAVGLADTAGVNELIASGETGLLTANDAAAFAEGLESMMTHPERRRAMGRAAVEAVRPYEPTAIFDRWETLFRRLAVSRNP